MPYAPPPRPNANEGGRSDPRKLQNPAGGHRHRDGQGPPPERADPSVRRAWPAFVGACRHPLRDVSTSRPMHLTAKLLPGLPSLRRRGVLAKFRRLRDRARGAGVRTVAYALMDDRSHWIVIAESRGALAAATRLVFGQLARRKVPARWWGVPPSDRGWRRSIPSRVWTMPYAPPPRPSASDRGRSDPQKLQNPAGGHRHGDGQGPPPERTDPSVRREWPAFHWAFRHPQADVFIYENDCT